MAKFSPRDRSRTEQGTSFSLVKRNTSPKRDQGGWLAISRDFLCSMAVRTLSHNSRKALDRLIIEHIDHNRTRNGRLIVTHDDFTEFGVTAEYVRDALDELEFKGLVRVKRGRAGNGTAHPNEYRLTFDGTHDGAKATNEWAACTRDVAKQWTETVREQMRLKRTAANTRKSSLRDSEVRPLRDSEVRRVG